MSGYKGYSMSNNAVRAYESGEMPFSKWTKAAIVSAVASFRRELALPSLDLSHLRKDELGAFLAYSSWHHTGSRYRRTDFYSLDEGFAERVDQDWVSATIESRKPGERSKKEAPHTIIALVEFDHWTGTRKHPKKTVIRETVAWGSDSKMVKTSVGMKRLSSLRRIG